MGWKIERHLSGVAGLALAAILTGCGASDDANPNADAASGKPQVFAVNYPLTYFAERIGGDAIDVQFPAPEEGDPAFWQPDGDAIAGFQSADLILRNGATYAKWTATASLPESIQVDTSAGFADAYIKIAEVTTHSHGSDGEHSHAGTAFTTWVDLGQAIQQADAIRAALAGLLPEQAETFAANFAELRTELESLDGDLAFAAQGLGDQPIAASHPVYQYAARRYGLKIRSLLWEPEVVPGEEAMADLKALLETHPAKLMLWEGEPAAESVAKLDALGIKSIVFDPCGNRPGEGEDFLSVMRGNIERLQAANQP